MSTTEILKKLEETTQELLQVLGSFDQDQLDIPPAASAWSAGQVAEHLIKASIVDILYGPVKPTIRPADQQVQELKDLFLNFTIQMTSPDFIMPTDAYHNKEAQLQALKKIGDQIQQAVQTQDLSATCLQAPRELGELTCLELVSFHLFHTQRHVYQLKKIFQQLVNQKTHV